MVLQKQNAIVSGAARGIGYASSLRLLREGAAVTLWDIDEKALEEAKIRLIETIPEAEGRVFTAACDVGNYGAVTARVEQAEKEMGGIDILINNAGYMAPGDLLAQPIEEWNKTVTINLNALIYTSYAVLPGMYERGYGHVVNVSSAAGFVGVPELSVYSATKWAVFGLTESLREEALLKSGGGVKFSSVHPMFLKTGMFEGAGLAGLGSLIFPRVASHDVIAKGIVESALKKGRRVVKRPRSLCLVLLLRGLLPDRLFNAISRLLAVNTSMSRLKKRKEGQ